MKIIQFYSLATALLFFTSPILAQNIRPLVAAGYYTYATGRSEGGGCPNPFLANTHHLPPPCGARCCRTEHQGAFEEDDPLEEEEDGVHNNRSGGSALSSSLGPSTTEIAAHSAIMGGGTAAPLPRIQFEPTDSTCRYKEISRGQVMRFLALHNSSFVVVGDSTMRQTFLRMVAMMRGQQRLVDPHVHTHAQYQVCREVDFLRLAANNPAGYASPSNPKFLKGQVPAFFRMEVGPGQADAKRVLSECSHPAIEMNYLQAPLWVAQEEVLERYFNGLPTGHKPTVIVSVGFWQPEARVPVSYLQALENLKDKALRVVYVGVPVSRVLDEQRRDHLTKRNAQMRRWVQNQGPPYSFVDFDAMVSAPGAPNGTSGSKHFTCWAEWKSARFPSGAVGNPAGTGQLTVNGVNKLHTDVDGTCADEMNRNLWQVILNGLLDSSGAQALATTTEPGGG
ncbi:hypothetical protein NADE_002524 [Nannochloris sp. 'desiccata']|nr:hypothetical protein KSW81_005757 [Chlorella desiccata (nom. nud.)]KAH7623334.1 hypothetical protein NADE_002524 [Chlorella desiccata (nom. nud.)]